MERRGIAGGRFAKARAGCSKRIWSGARAICEKFHKLAGSLIPCNLWRIQTALVGTGDGDEERLPESIPMLPAPRGRIAPPSAASRSETPFDDREGRRHGVAGRRRAGLRSLVEAAIYDVHRRKPARRSAAGPRQAPRL